MLVWWCIWGMLGGWCISMVGLRFGWWGWDTAWVIFMAMVRSVGFGGLGRLCMLGGWCRDMLVGGASPWWGLGLDGGGGTLPESLWGTWPWSGLWALVVVVVWACWVGVHHHAGCVPVHPGAGVCHCLGQILGHV